MPTMNESNLRLVLNEITNRAKTGRPMDLTVICRNNHIGQTTMHKLKWALLEAKWTPACKSKPIPRMHVCEDGKTWKFNFGSSTGARNWIGLCSDWDDLLYWMSQCPPEVSNPSYYKKTSNQQTSVDEQPQIVPEDFSCEERSLMDFSDDELTAEKFELTQRLEAINAEFARREEVRAKQAQLQDILELADLTLDQLLDLINCI